MPVPEIKNIDEILAVKEPARTMRKNLLDMAMAGIEAVIPETLIPSVLTRHGNTITVKGMDGSSLSFDLSDYERIYIAGAGKASADMGRAVAKIMGGYIEGGHINSILDEAISMDRGEITLTRAGHPVPDERGLEGAEKIRGIFASARKDDLIIFLLSGGASSMLSLPAEGIEPEDMITATDALLRSGASIQEMNCVRRHISAVKGGKLAADTEAAVLTLIISDVMGNELESIGSGPTAPDPTTYEDALAVIDRYNLGGKMPERVMQALNEGNETVKPDDPRLKGVRNIIIADNSTAVKAMETVAEKRNCRFRTLHYLTGEVDETAKRLAAECTPPGLCLGGGEMTLTVKGQGKGGRCQEFLLRLFMHGYRGIALATGTDGLDGNSGAAGGIFDTQAMEEAGRRGLFIENFLEQSSSYSLLSELGTAILTGYTGTNVGDLYILLPFGGKRKK